MFMQMLAVADFQHWLILCCVLGCNANMTVLDMPDIQYHIHGTNATVSRGVTEVSADDSIDRCRLACQNDSVGCKYWYIETYLSARSKRRCISSRYLSPYANICAT